MFLSKQQHMARAEELGIKCLAFYNGLFLEMSFSSWLQIDIRSVLTLPAHSQEIC